MAFDRSTVKNLPKGAGVQVIKNVPYVYFRYTWRDEQGTLKYARDYLGIVEDNQFVPNDYYLRVKPTKDYRPAERWSATERKKRAIEAIKPEPKSSEASEETPASVAKEGTAQYVREIETKSVGVTALAAMILRDNGLMEDVLAIFDGDYKKALRVLNLAIGAAITAKPTYLSSDESAVQMFLNNKPCLTSPRASELHWDIGQALDLSAQISKCRIARLNREPMLALDGSRINCDSDNIIDASVGKAKDGTFTKQINFSLLVDAENGAPVGYRWFSGATNDVSTLEDFTSIWNAYGLMSKDPMIVVDRGYYSQEGLVKLGKQGYRFLAGAKTGFRLVKSMIEDRNSEFYEASALMDTVDCYGIEEKKVLKSSEGEIDVTVSVFRNPVEEMAETRRFFKRLTNFEETWDKGKAQEDDPLLDFYKNPKKGQKLVRDMYTISQECYLLGYFAFVSNANISLNRSLEIYKLRNEAEVVFKLMLSNLMRSTRVHSTQALEGLLFTTFIALSILTGLRFRMKNMLGTNPVSSTYTISEIFARLKKIQLVTINGKDRHLINVSRKDKQLIAALGYPKLFDSVENVTDPLRFPV